MQTRQPAYLLPCAYFSVIPALLLPSSLRVLSRHSRPSFPVIPALLFPSFPPFFSRHPGAPCPAIPALLSPSSRPSFFPRHPREGGDPQTQKPPTSIITSHRMIVTLRLIELVMYTQLLDCPVS